MDYFISTLPTPLLNRPDFANVFGGTNGSLPFDQQNLVRPLEMIAFPGTVFTIQDEPLPSIFEVFTSEYSSSYPLYLDTRFGKRQKAKPLGRKKNLPEKATILDRLRKQIGSSYIWGGNYAAGIPQLFAFYPPPSGKELTTLERKSWIFQGVDCSGLFYEAADGAVPRNTKDLLFFGEGIKIASLSTEKILEILRPLDLIVWKGHVVIVFDHESTLESNCKWGGVCQMNLKRRLDSIREEDQKTPGDDPIEALQNPNIFLVRRFIP